MDVEWEKHLDDHRKRVKEMAKLVFDNCDEVSESTELLEKIKGVVAESEQVKVEAAKRQAAVRNTVGRIEEDQNWKEIDITRLHQEEQQKVEEQPPPSYNHVREFDEFLSNLRLDSDDSFTMTQQPSQPPNDPWTLKPIKHRMKSKRCGHYYEKASVMVFTKGKKEVKCPYVGCQKFLKLADFEDD